MGADCCGKRPGIATVRYDVLQLQSSKELCREVHGSLFAKYLIDGHYNFPWLEYLYTHCVYLSYIIRPTGKWSAVLSKRSEGSSWVSWLQSDRKRQLSKAHIMYLRHGLSLTLPLQPHHRSPGSSYHIYHPSLHTLWAWLGCH